MRLAPELAEKPPIVPRPAPVAMSLGSRTNSATLNNVLDKGWTFPAARASVETDETDIKDPDAIRELHHSPAISPGEVPSTPRGMSFFDVGGLLGENNSPRRPPKRHSTAVPQQQNINNSQSPLMASPNLQPRSASMAVPGAGSVGSRRGSHALLQDIGGLLSPAERQATATSRPTPNTRDSSLIDALQSTPPNTSSRNQSKPMRRQRGSLEIQDVGGLLS